MVLIFFVTRTVQYVFPRLLQVQFAVRRFLIKRDRRRQHTITTLSRICRQLSWCLRQGNTINHILSSVLEEVHGQLNWFKPQLQFWLIPVSQKLLSCYAILSEIIFKIQHYKVKLIILNSTSKFRHYNIIMKNRYSLWDLLKFIFKSVIQLLKNIFFPLISL